MILKTWTTRSKTVPPNCARCEAMNGQSVSLNALFQTPDGKYIDRPPLHPHCDCILTWTNETGGAVGNW